MNLYKSNKKGGTTPTGNKAITIDSVGTTSGIDVANYATASVTTDGLYKPSGIKDNTGSSYTTNGTKTITGLENYTGVKINVNVSASASHLLNWSGKTQISTTLMTTSSAGALIGTGRSGETIPIELNGSVFCYIGAGGSGASVNWHGIPSGTTIKLSKGSANIFFVPYSSYSGKTLNLSSAHEITTTEWTTQSVGVIMGVAQSSATVPLVIDGTTVTFAAGAPGNTVYWGDFPSGITLRITQANSTKLYFVPYNS